MAQKTYLQLVNEVMIRLREDEVTSVASTPFSKLIGKFVNDTKREMDVAWDWLMLRQTIQVTTVSGTFRYTLTSADNRYKILQVFNDTQDMELRMADYRQMNRNFLTGNPQRTAPTRYDINGQSNGDPNVDMWPIPDRAYVINFNMVIPGVNNSAGNFVEGDFTNDDDVAILDENVIYLGAVARAFSERGEDGGSTTGEAWQLYTSALSDAIALDQGKTPTEGVWDTARRKPRNV